MACLRMVVVSEARARANKKAAAGLAQRRLYSVTCDHQKGPIVRLPTATVPDNRSARDPPPLALLRRFWLPVLLSEELPEADGPPKKIVVMGEELLAFRDSRGVVGVIDQYCPHSGDPAAVVCNFLNSIRRAKGTLADPK